MSIVIRKNFQNLGFFYQKLSKDGNFYKNTCFLDSF